MRAEHSVLPPRPASSRRRVGGGGPGAGGVGGSLGSGRSRPVAAAGSAEGARASVPGPARRQESREAGAAEACSALRGPVPLGWGFPGRGGRVWEHAQSCPGHPSLSPPPATVTTPAILRSARTSDGPVRVEAGARRSSRHQPSLTVSLPASPGPWAVTYLRSPGCAAVRC